MRWTKETACKTPGCEYEFPCVPVLYGDRAFSKCPSCGAIANLALYPEGHQPEQDTLALEIVCPEKPGREEAQTANGARGDWACPYCGHLNSHLNRHCQECGEMYGEPI